MGARALVLVNKASKVKKITALSVRVAPLPLLFLCPCGLARL